MKQITSVQNPYIKSLLQLQDKAKVRRQTGTFIIEGKREIELALKGGYELETILFVADLISEKELSELKITSAEKIEISKKDNAIIFFIMGVFFLIYLLNEIMRKVSII